MSGLVYGTVFYKIGPTLVIVKKSEKNLLSFQDRIRYMAGGGVIKWGKRPPDALPVIPMIFSAFYCTACINVKTTIGSDITWVAMPAWSVPGTHKTFTPCDLFLLAITSWMVHDNACPEKPYYEDYLLLRSGLILEFFVLHQTGGIYRLLKVYHKTSKNTYLKRFPPNKF